MGGIKPLVSKGILTRKKTRTETLKPAHEHVEHVENKEMKSGTEKRKKEEMDNAKIQPPHVYEALGNILKYMAVEKDGTLPGNMGSKPYVSAPALSEEVKRQLVTNNILLLSNEKVVSQEAIIHKDRLNIRVVIQGTYTLVSLVDQSQASIVGVGDGLATGTSVSSNIASTNALKNALLRTFLITEQAVEEAGMSELKDADEPVKKAPATAKLEAAKAKSAQAQGKNQLKVMREWVGEGKPVSSADGNALFSKLKKENPDLKGEDIFGLMLEMFAKGELG